MPDTIDKIRAEGLYQKLESIIERGIADKIVFVELRQILEGIYKALAENAPVTLSGLFARMQYVHGKLDFSNRIPALANRLRIKCNEIIHEIDATVDPEEVKAGVMTIVAIISAISELPPSPIITEYLKGFERKASPPPTKGNRIDLLGIVQEWQVLDNKDNTPHSIEIHITNEQGDDCTVTLTNEERYNSVGRNWTILAKTLWKYATIRFQNLSAVCDQELCFKAKPETFVVLEPDFLIDSSAIAECFSHDSCHPEMFIVSKLLREPSSEPAISGSAVNTILDEMILEPGQDYTAMFRKCLAANPISMIALGLDTALSMHKQIEAVHVPRINKFCTEIASSEVLLEPSFICPEYGLQGRLDILAKKDGKYSIVELKSGKPPQQDVWKAHQMQVISYNMIIKSCFGKEHIDFSSIFYSACTDEKLLRHVVNISSLEQDLLMCRNRIVGILHQLSEDPQPLLTWLQTTKAEYSNPIHNTKIREIQRVLNDIHDYEVEWMLAQIRCIISEVWCVKVGSTGNPNHSLYGFSSLWKEAPEVKTENYELLTDLTIASFSQNTIQLSQPQTDLISNFRIGDVIVFYQKDVPVTQQELLRGVITSLNEEQVELRLRGGLKNSHKLNQNTLWSLEHDILETSLYSPLSSLFMFLKADPAKRAMFMGISEPRVSQTVSNDDYIQDLVLKIDAAQDYFIVQGPPGTGKTSGLLTSYIRHQYEHSTKNILILSFTNRAVDEICLNLQRSKIPFIRTGSSQTIKENILSELITNQRFQQIDHILRENRIWVATVQSCNAWYLDLLSMLDMDELIIDEASQIIEAGVLGIISKVPKVVLIGDQNQLPPIVIQPPHPMEFTHPVLKDTQYSIFSQSLMERLSRCAEVHKRNDTFFMLYKHYRMHSHISELIHPYYNNQLHAETPRQYAELVPIASHSSSLLTHRIGWINTPPSAEYHYDPHQVEIIISLIQMLVSTNIVTNPATEIGIIAPFRAMIHAIVKSLPPEFRDVTIDTVERYQGSERAIMILCLPLKSKDDIRGIESLSYDATIDRKLNVAVSRAKERLYIVGNEDICSISNHYHNLIDKIKAQHFYIQDRDFILG